MHPGPSGNPAIDRLSSLATRLLGVASAEVALSLDVSSQVGSHGMPASEPRDIPLTESLNALTTKQRRPVIINDTRSDARSSDLPSVVSGATGCYLGVPIAVDDDTVVGAFCVFDPATRLWTQQEVEMVKALAHAAGTELELAALTRDFNASRARWDLAIEAAGVGSFDWDLRTGRLEWDDTLIEMFGYGDDEVFEETIDAFNARLHPDDLPAVGRALRTAIDTVGEYEAEYRVVLPSGTIRQIQARGRALGADGLSDRLLGAAWDVTATRTLEDRAARIVEAMPVAYVRIDAEGVVTSANSSAERLLDHSRTSLIDHVLWSVVPEIAAAGLDRLAAGALATGESVTQEIRVSDPAEVWLELRLWPDDSGLSIFFTDVTARHDKQEQADRRAAHDRTVARTMQDALLTTLPSPDHLELFARYVTAARDDRVGGDWYDAIIQPNGATTLVVGDVAGHDIHAAATMGQLRSMHRAFIWQGDEAPAQLLHRLDRAMEDLYPDALATAITARLEQDEDARRRGVHLLRWSNAGHPPPILLDADGGTRILDTTPELLLGVMPDAPRSDSVTELPPGSTLLLYTDGLIERRGRAVQAGIHLLMQSARRHRERDLPDLIDAILDELLTGEIDDDVVLFAVRLHPKPS